jgi:hypothetical protein
MIVAKKEQNPAPTLTGSRSITGRSLREEYQEFKPAVFTKRIHQEIKTNKWYKSQYDGAYGKF